MKATGCLFVILACVGIGIGVYLNSSVANNLNALKQDVARNCEKAKPILQRRYQSVDPLIRAYELHFGWSNGVFVGNPRQFDQKWQLLQPGGMDITSITPELEASEAVRRGMTAFQSRGPALAQIDGANEMEHHLPDLVAAAIRYDAVNDKTLLEQLKSDIIATDQDTTTAAAAINAAVKRYNSRLDSFPGSNLGKRQGFEPMTLEFRVVGGETY